MKLEQTSPAYTLEFTKAEVAEILRQHANQVFSRPDTSWYPGAGLHIPARLKVEVRLNATTLYNQLEEDGGRVRLCW